MGLSQLICITEFCVHSRLLSHQHVFASCSNCFFSVTCFHLQVCASVSMRVCMHVHLCVRVRACVCVSASPKSTTRVTGLLLLHSHLTPSHSHLTSPPLMPSVYTVVTEVQDPCFAVRWLQGVTGLLAGPLLLWGYFRNKLSVCLLVCNTPSLKWR